MTTQTQQSSATIYRFPIGGRAGLAKGFEKNAERAATPYASARHIDWRAAYHGAAIEESTYSD